MNRLERLTLWSDLLAAESANLVRDYRASMIVDADHGPSLNVRIAALRGLTARLSAKACPVPSAWEAAADFLPIVRLFVEERATPALRLELVDRVIAAADRLTKALADGERPRADVFG